MPALGITLTGDSRPAEAAYSRVTAMAAAMNAEIAKQQAMVNNIPRSGQAAVMTAQLAERYNPTFIKKFDAAGATAGKGFFSNFMKGLQGQGSGGISQLVSVVSNTLSSLGSGMSPARIIAQQGPNIVQGFLSLSGNLIGKIIGFVLNPLTLAVTAATGAVAVFGYMVYKHFKNMQAGLEHVGQRFGLAKTSISELNEEMRRGAESAASFRDFLHSLGDKALTAAQKTEILIKRLNEQLDAEREIAKARGASPQQVLNMETIQLQKQLDIIERAKEAAYAKLAADKASAIEIEKQLEAGGDDRVKMGRAYDEATFYAKVQDVAGKKLGLGDLWGMADRGFGNTILPGDIVGSNPMTGQPIYGPGTTVDKKIKQLENTLVDLDIEGRHFHGTLADAVREQKGYNAIGDKLAKVQAELQTLLEKKKNLTQSDADSIRSLGKQESDLIAALNFKKKYGQKLSDAQGMGGRGSGIDLTANQRINAWALMPMQNAAIMIQRDQLTEQKKTNALIEKHWVQNKDTGSWRDVINGPFE